MVRDAQYKNSTSAKSRATSSNNKNNNNNNNIINNNVNNNNSKNNASHLYFMTIFAQPSEINNLLSY